jgi:Ser/Thr protein kinase RdoA (MazF antagonist)
MIIGGLQMKDFFQFDTNENIQALLARARKVALAAIQQYDLEWESIRFIQLSDTITYKIETTANKSYLLRIHSDRLSKEEILSELAWLQTLNKSIDLTVPEGLASSEGSYVLEIETDEEYRRPYVTIMQWVEGEHASEIITESQAYNMGVMMGHLHEANESFGPPADFVRPVWGKDSFRNEMSMLEQYYTCFLSEKAWKSYQAAADKIISQIEVMHPHHNNYGLIHGDMHSGNVVFNNDLPYPIDFGRCGYGYYLYDLASTLLELSPKNRISLIKGYESVKELGPDYALHLECFFIMVMIGNYCHHSSDPRETANLIDEQPYAQAYISKYMNDTPFLFDRIEPVEID